MCDEKYEDTSHGMVVQSSDNRADLQLMRNQAQYILLLARKKARTLLDGVKQEARLIEEKARKEGYNKGYKEGLEKGKQDGVKQIQEKGRNLLDEMDTIQKKFGDSVEALLKGLQMKIIDIILVSVNKIIHKEIASDDELVLRTIKSAAERLTSRDSVQLIVHRESLEKVLENSSQLVMDMDNVSDINVTAGKVDKGGCMLDAREGLIDARIDSQLEAVSEIIGTA